SLPHGAAPADGHPPGLLRVVPPTGNGAHRCTDAEGTLTEGGRLMSWLDDDELDSETSADPTAEEQPAGDGDGDDQEGTPLPYLDPDMAAGWDGEGGAPPEWLGVRWRDIDVEHQGEAWVWLRRWVEWFADTYRLRRATIPRCWFQHPGIVEELYAAMCLEHKVWESKEPNVAAVTMWHNNLPPLVERLKAMTQEAGCEDHTSSGHIEPEPLAPEVDEDAWAATVGRRSVRTTIPRPQTGVRGVRAVVADEDGTELAYSQPVGIKARAEEEAPEAVTDWGARGGWSEDRKSD